MKTPIFTIVIAIVLVSTYLILGPMPDSLIFHNSAPQLWQWITAHYVHIGFEHLCWNLIAFFILGSLIEQHSAKRLMLSLGFGMGFVNIYLFSLFPMSVYAGLSGVLNSLLVVALYQLYQKPDYQLVAAFSFCASIVKLLYEWVSDTAVFSSLAWPSVPEAHLAGLVGGLMLCSILRIKSKSTETDKQVYHAR